MKLLSQEVLLSGRWKGSLRTLSTRVIISQCPLQRQPHSLCPGTCHWITKAAPRMGITLSPPHYLDPWSAKASLWIPRQVWRRVLMLVLGREFKGNTGNTLPRICLQCKRCWFYPWVVKIPWRREGLPTSVFWSGEFHEFIVLGVSKSQTRLSDFH